MSGAQWIALAVGAVIVFWMVGAYNRLVALRSTIGETLAQGHDFVQRRAAAAQALAAAVAEPMTAERSTLDAWLAAQLDAQRAFAALRARPVMAALAAAASVAESASAGSTSRVLALLDQHPGLGAEAAVAGPLAALREADARLGFARQLFNDAAQNYNDAVRQFPTRLVARLFGFGTAGRL